MNDEDSQGGLRGDGGDSPSDADAWVAQWVDLFERPDPTEEPDRSGTPGRGVGPGGRSRRSGPIGPIGPSRPAEVGEPIVSSPDRGAGADPGSGSFRSSLGRRLAGAERNPSDSDDLAAIEAWRRAQERSRRKAQVLANQRAARQIQRMLPTRSDPSQPVAGVAVDVRSHDHGAVRRLGLVAGGLLVATVGLIGYLFIGLGGSTDPTAGPGPTVPEREPELGLTVGADVAPATIEELTQSTVQLVGLDDDLVPQCAGSGVIVASSGAILTNSHVVTSGSGEGSCRFSLIGVGVTVDSLSQPELLYRAEVDQVGPGVDLAVLHITGPLTEDSEAPWPRTFMAAPLGDSDTVKLGDPVRILGYPVIGGDTITLTTGTVSGFTSQVGLGNRALIKTDASISAGNSGGLAIDADGRVIGIPTKARASERGPAVDCRPVSDTNADGVIGEDDACVTVGGFLNGIRPINLSLELLAAANVSDEARAAGPVPTVDPDQVTLSNPRFSTGIDRNGVPIDEIVTATAGVPQLCFSFDWQGMPLGAAWDAGWYYDTMLDEDNMYVSRTWTGSERGESFSLCRQAPDDAGLPAGIHEIAFYLDGNVVFVEGIEITASPVEQFPITWTNDTDTDLCGLAINPAATSGQLGLDELPPGRMIPRGDGWTTIMAEGRVIVEAYDCNGEAVANQFDGLPIEQGQSYSIER